MKRTTIFLDEQLERELQALARRQGRPMAGLVREAVEHYVVEARELDGPASRHGFVALGRSGHRDIAERHEELLWQEPSGSPDTTASSVAKKGIAPKRALTPPRRQRGS
jgi:predicted transcriptional regulator